MGNGHYSLICSTLLCLGNELLCNEFFKKLIILSTFSFKQYLSTGSSLGSSCGEVGLSNVTTNSLHDRNAEGRKLPEHSLVWCSKSQNKGPQIASNFSETTVVEVETIVQNENFGSCSDRFVQQIFIPCKIFESSYIAMIIFFLFYTEMLVNNQVILQGHWNLPPKNHKLQKATVFALHQGVLCGLKLLTRHGGLLRYVMLPSSITLSCYHFFPS